MNSKIIIKKVDELPDYVKNNDVEYWDYPVEELEHIFDMVDDGSFENGTKTLDASRRNGTDKPVQCC